MKNINYLKHVGVFLCLIVSINLSYSKSKSIENEKCPESYQLTFFHINGVRTDDVSDLRNIRLRYKDLERQGKFFGDLEASKTCLQIGYNETNGALLDFLETFLQKFTEAENDLGITLLESDLSKFLFDQNLFARDVLEDLVEQGKGNVELSELLTELSSVKIEHLASVREETLEKLNSQVLEQVGLGKPPMIIVSHSQGNLFANELVERLKLGKAEEGRVKEYSDFVDRSLANLQIGSAAGSFSLPKTKRGHYTHPADLIINVLLRKAGENLGFTVLPANFRYFERVDTGNYEQHGFIETYTNETTYGTFNDTLIGNENIIYPIHTSYESPLINITIEDIDRTNVLDTKGSPTKADDTISTFSNFIELYSGEEKPTNRILTMFDIWAGKLDTLAGEIVDAEIVDPKVGLVPISISSDKALVKARISSQFDRLTIYEGQYSDIFTKTIDESSLVEVTSFERLEDLEGFNFRYTSEDNFAAEFTIEIPKTFADNSVVLIKSCKNDENGVEDCTKIIPFALDISGEDPVTDCNGFGRLVETGPNENFVDFESKVTWDKVSDEQWLWEVKVKLKDGTVLSDLDGFKLYQGLSYGEHFLVHDKLNEIFPFDTENFSRGAFFLAYEGSEEQKCTLSDVSDFRIKGKQTFYPRIFPVNYNGVEGNGLYVRFVSSDLGDRTSSLEVDGVNIPLNIDEHSDSFFGKYLKISDEPKLLVNVRAVDYYGDVEEWVADNRREHPITNINFHPVPISDFESYIIADITADRNADMISSRPDEPMFSFASFFYVGTVERPNVELDVRRSCGTSDAGTSSLGITLTEYENFDNFGWYFWYDESKTYTASCN